MKTYKTIRWNLGLMMIYAGEKIRSKFWKIGVFILGIAYKLRGDVPMKHWKITDFAYKFLVKRHIL